MFELPWSEVVYRSDRARSEERDKAKKLSTVVEVDRLTKNGYLDLKFDSSNVIFLPSLGRRWG